MLRALLAAVLCWCTLVSGAHACLGTNLHEGVVFEAVPWNAPPDALILRVEFDRADVRRIAGPRPTTQGREWLLIERIAVDARVIEVIRGEFDQPTVRVAIGGSSCDSPFIFGTSGLLVGRMVTPEEGQARLDAWHPSQPSSTARDVDGVLIVSAPRLTWPFTEPVLDAITENRDDRDLRHAGLAALAEGPFISGDYDGDGRIDTARYFEDSAGALIIGVQLGARRHDDVQRICSADRSNLPYFAFSTAPTGTYRTMAHLYDQNSGVPREVSLAHDAIIVTALEGPAELLYYWDGATFQNIVISE